MNEKAPENKEEIKEAKYLFIDDEESVIHTYSRLFAKQDAKFVLCKNIGDVLKAIEETKPKVLFLDNSIGTRNVGLEAATQLKDSGIIIVSVATIEDQATIDAYKNLGIENISKMDFDTIKSIMDKRNN
jgi:DNA-binding NtrC family response regulator